jgi:CheY-like chemotaxis protein
VNVNSLVVEFSEMLVRTLGEQVDLRLDLRPGLPACHLDPTHLEMALLNVLINARDAMPAGGEVTVGTSLVRDERVKAHRLPPGAYIVLCVVDKGTGMSPDVLRRATEPFFTTKGPGTGLGLAMVHGFVQQSHGKLEIDSRPGEGTTVRMIFPIADQPDPSAALAAEGDAQADTEATGHPPAPRASVLVVEDNDDVRELAESVLTMAGYAVQSAASGERALALLEGGAAADLLFTDVIMPGGINGLQLAEQARTLRPDLPVLVTTGYMDELPAAQAARDAPGNRLDVLAKPYKHEDLLERVEAALGK